MKNAIKVFIFFVAGIGLGIVIERQFLSPAIDGMAYGKAAATITNALTDDAFFNALTTLVAESERDTQQTLDAAIKTAQLTPAQLLEIKSCIAEFNDICQHLNELINTTELPSDLQKVYVDLVWEISEGSVYIPAKARDKALRKLAYQNSKYYSLLKKMAALQSRCQTLFDKLSAHISQLPVANQQKLKVIGQQYIVVLKKYLYALTKLHDPMMQFNRFYALQATQLPFLIALEQQLKNSVENWGHKVMQFLSISVNELARMSTRVINDNITQKR